jgi:hypothetical protein
MKTETEAIEPFCIWRVIEQGSLDVEYGRGVYESSRVSLMEFGLTERASILSTGSNGSIPCITLERLPDLTEVEFPAFEGYSIWSAEVAKDTLRITFTRED